MSRSHVGQHVNQPLLTMIRTEPEPALDHITLKGPRGPMGLVDCEPSSLRPPAHHPYSLRLTQDTITAIPGGPLVG
ncbi:uncharacterized protein METZ01_LOCUS349087, partial [marine metagenome]